MSACTGRLPGCWTGLASAKVVHALPESEARLGGLEEDGAPNGLLLCRSPGLSLWLVGAD